MRKDIIPLPPPTEGYRPGKNMTYLVSMLARGSCTVHHSISSQWLNEMYCPVQNSKQRLCYMFSVWPSPNN